MEILLTVPFHPGGFALSPPVQNQLCYGRDGAVYVVDIGTGAETKVFDGSGGGRDWSPDGSTIAFASGPG